MSAQEAMQREVEADKEYAEQEFQFTFNRKEISAIAASLQVCYRSLDPFARGLIRSALERIEGHEEYQQSKRPRKGALS